MTQVNFELSPFLRMSVPRDARDKSIEDAPIDHLAFMSVILLFGIIPIDLHFVHLTEVEPGHRFVETSYTLVNATWRHERAIYVLPNGKGCQITDNIGIRPRLPFAGVVVKPLARALFAHRHRKLLAQFGAPR
jgi:ligand-binding SRPBCC domain-containing protein